MMFSSVTHEVVFAAWLTESLEAVTTLVQLLLPSTSIAKKGHPFIINVFEAEQSYIRGSILGSDVQSNGLARICELARRIKGLWPVC